MGVSLSNEEIDEFLKAGHTLILGTIRKSGEPMATPLWYLWQDGVFYVSTFARTTKLGHIRRDPRVCALVEDGKHYLDLRAVVASCTAELVEEPKEVERIGGLLRAKYKDFSVDFSGAGKATQQRYAGQVILKLVPKPGGIRSWYNRKLRLPKAT